MQAYFIPLTANYIPQQWYLKINFKISLEISIRLLILQRLIDMWYIVKVNNSYTD